MQRGISEVQEQEHYLRDLTKYFKINALHSEITNVLLDTVYVQFFSLS